MPRRAIRNTALTLSTHVHKREVDGIHVVRSTLIHKEQTLAVFESESGLTRLNYFAENFKARVHDYFSIMSQADQYYSQATMDRFLLSLKHHSTEFANDLFHFWVVGADGDEELTTGGANVLADMLHSSCEKSMYVYDPFPHLNFPWSFLVLRKDKLDFLGDTAIISPPVNSYLRPGQGGRTNSRLHGSGLRILGLKAYSASARYAEDDQLESALSFSGPSRCGNELSVIERYIGGPNHVNKLKPLDAGPLNPRGRTTLHRWLKDLEPVMHINAHLSYDPSRTGSPYTLRLSSNAEVSGQEFHLMDGDYTDTFVFLSCCNSNSKPPRDNASIPAILLDLRATAVLGTDTEVNAVHCFGFVETFYEALRTYQGRLTDALLAARARIQEREHIPIGHMFNVEGEPHSIVAV